MKIESYGLEVDGNLALHQLDDTSFLDFMSRCSACACTGGFESICEAMYLRKPVMMAPAHIEQECNAFDVSRQRWWICRGGF